MSSSTDDAASDRIPVGYVRRAHGVRGDVIIRPLTDYPKRFAPGATVTTDEEPPRRLTVASRRAHTDGLLIRFDSIGDRNEAELLQGVTLTISPEERRPLAEGEYWTDSLEGLVAIDSEGTRLGVVVAVELGAAQDRLVIATDEGQVEIPFVADLVGEVHPSGGHVVILQPEAFFD